MARRRESLIDLLLVLPWWVGLAVGAVGYLFITFVPPFFISDGPLALVARNLRPVALIWVTVCTCAAAGSAVRTFLVGRKFNQQNDLSDIRSLSWRQFESIVGEAFRRRGFQVTENACDGPDGGVDLVLRKGDERYFVQCKQWRSMSVGVKPVRELYGVMAVSGVAGGFFVTSGTYTAEARAFAANTSIELIDGAGLARMISEGREPQPFIDPTSSRLVVAAVDPTCPRCGGAMVVRTARRGAKVGAGFWGCAQYPRCKGTREI